MATITIKGIGELRKRLGARFKIAINKTLRDRGLRLRIGLIVEKDIRDTFKATPAPATKKIREYFERNNQTHPAYSRDKINITFTGELLRDLATNVKADTTTTSFILEHSDKKHKLYKLVPKSELQRKSNRKTPRARSSYSEIQGYLDRLGYDYLKISNEASKEITKVLQEVLFKNIAEAL